MIKISVVGLGLPDVSQRHVRHEKQAIIDSAGVAKSGDAMRGKYEGIYW